MLLIQSRRAGHHNIKRNTNNINLILNNIICLAYNDLLDGMYFRCYSRVIKRFILHALSSEANKNPWSAGICETI